MSALALILVAHLGDSLPCQVRGSQEWLAARASPLDSVTVVVGTARAKICYSRPRARGRSVYDSLAPFGIAWRTGANEPTTLQLDGPAMVGGTALTAGRYVIITVPNRTEWLIVFHTATGTDPVEVFRTMKPIATAVAAAESTTVLVEQFAIRGAPPDRAPGFLFEWGHLRVYVPVEPRSGVVRPQR